MNNPFIGMSAGALISIAMALWVGVGVLEKQDDQEQQSLYCEMVGIYKETKGEYGWPDYKGIAGEICK